MSRFIPAGRGAGSAWMARERHENPESVSSRAAGGRRHWGGRRRPVGAAGIPGFGNAFGVGSRSGPNCPRSGDSRKRAGPEKSLGTDLGRRAPRPGRFPGQLRGLSRNRRQWEDASGGESLSQSPGSAGGCDPGSQRRTDPLHHRKRSPTHRHARLEQSAQGILGKQLEARPLHSEPSSAPRRRTVAADGDRWFSPLRGLPGLREMPCGDLCALEEDADGQCCAGPAGRIPTPLFPILPPTPSPSSPRIRWPSSTAACGSNAISPRSATIIFLCPCNGTWAIARGVHIWSPRGRLVDGRVSSRQHAAAHRPLCDGCHSVDYDIHTKQVAEWNVGCERCHGPGSEHVAHPTRGDILNPAHLDYVAANDTCIQCHSQGQPLKNPDRRKVLRLAGRLSRRSKTAGLLEARRLHSGRNQLLLISRTAPRTRTACRATTSRKA